MTARSVVASFGVGLMASSPVGADEGALGVVPLGPGDLPQQSADLGDG